MNKFVSKFEFNGTSYYYYDLKKLYDNYPSLKKLPNSLKILLESNIRNSRDENINSIIDTFINNYNFKTISFSPTRVIMQDFEGVPALVDFASLRDLYKSQNKDTSLVNPKVMFDLVMDDEYVNSADTQKEISRNKQRYDFVKWASKSFENLCIIPPSSSIYHQVNLEYLSTMISAKAQNDKIYIFPESLVGTDNHASIINALGVFSYKTTSIESQSVILDDKLNFNLPQVVGVKIEGSFVQGVSISDAVLSLTNILKEHKIENKIIEFYGDALKNISIEDRATISTNCFEYDALCAYFPIDDNTISFVEQTRGVDASLIKEYYLKQGLYNSPYELEFDEYITFDLSKVRPMVSGPTRFQDKLAVEHIPSKLNSFKNGNFIKDNDIVFASIRFCTHTSNPILLIQAALLAKKASLLGISINSNIKRALVLDSLVLKEYLVKLDLLKYFENLGFEIQDFTNMVCSDFREDLVERVVLDIEKFNLNTSAVISSKAFNEGKLNPLVKSNWLMSPALVIAFCLKGNMNFDITKEPINADIYLSDIWPSIVEVNEALEAVDSSLYTNAYKDILLGNEKWQNLEVQTTDTFSWQEDATYIKQSSLYEGKTINSINIDNAKILALFDDEINCEYISPSGQVPPYSSSAVYLQEKGLRPDEFNTYERRYGNSELMARATLSNINLKNKMVYPKEGGYTKDFTSGELLSIFDFSQKAKEMQKDLVLFVGDNFGAGEFKDWAVKGIKLLGIKVIFAKSFDEKYRKNLVRVGVLPLEFIDDDIESLKLKGDETISINTNFILPESKIDVEIKKYDEIRTIKVLVRLDDQNEVEYYKNGGALTYLLNK